MSERVSVVGIDDTGLPIDDELDELDVPELEDDELAEHDDAAPGSLLARLRQQTAQVRQERTLELQVGALYDPPLRARYGALPVHEVDKYIELAQGSGTLEGAIELMRRTCRELVTSDGRRDVVLADETGPVTYGYRLALLLGMPIPPGGAEAILPRDVVLALFERSGLAILTHAGELMQWMIRPQGKSPGEASGEAG